MAARRARPVGRESRNKGTGRALRTQGSTRRKAPLLSHEGWTFLSNHSHVLVVLARGKPLSLREVALEVGITERSVQRIVSDLQEAGYVKKAKLGRGNLYSINSKLPLRHPLETHCNVGQLLDVIGA